MGVLLAFLVARQHPASHAKQQGGKMPPGFRLTSPGSLAILRGVGCAVGGSTLFGGSGVGRKTPDSPVNFNFGSIAHFGRTREAVYPDDLKKGDDTSCMMKYWMYPTMTGPP